MKKKTANQFCSSKCQPISIYTYTYMLKFFCHELETLASYFETISSMAKHIGIYYLKLLYVLVYEE